MGAKSIEELWAERPDPMTICPQHFAPGEVERIITEAEAAHDAHLQQIRERLASQPQQPAWALLLQRMIPTSRRDLNPTQQSSA